MRNFAEVEQIYTLLLVFKVVSAICEDEKKESVVKDVLI